MKLDLAAISRDPRFGDGGHAQTEAFLEGATALGRTSRLLYDVHPGIRRGGLTWRRVEALRSFTAARRVEVPASRSLWVVSTHASDGYAAISAGRAYACWIGTTVDSEWRGRKSGMRATHRAAAGLSIPALRALERQVLRRADAVYATSAASREQVAAAGRREDVEILRIPIDVARFSPAPDTLWRQALDAPTIVFVGRADDPRKNVALLIAAARLLPDVRVLLAGARPLAVLPPNVRAIGRVPDVPAILRTGVVFALPSRQEGFGIAAAEALACGLPVITTPSGGPEELIRESRGGVVTETFDADEFAAVARSMLERPDELAAMRERGRAFVERIHSPAAFRIALAPALARSET
jgi:D-inositol-3-phosphate glycosyltransferase